MIGSGDLLLRWMSEVGSGAVQNLRTHIAWVNRTNSQADHAQDVSENDLRMRSGRWLRDQITVGHIDVEWDRGKARWRTAPPVFTTIPGGFGYALLTGGRPARLDDALVENEAIVHRISRPFTDDDFDQPTAVFISYQSGADLADIASGLGVRFVPDAAQRLAESLERIAPGPPCAPPVMDGSPVEKWNPGKLRFDRVDLSSVRTPGMYRQKVLGRQRHMLRLNDAWFLTSRVEGAYLAAHPLANHIRWRRDPASQEDIGTVFIDAGMSLPDPQRRVLGLCTGLGPKVGKQSRNTRYDNVPRSVADVVAASLRQKLSTLSSDEEEMA